jgi:UDP-N-acetylmuramate--alanine ligase
MSALAYVLAKRKLPVSGSDICLNHITERLQAEGAKIFWSQEASNLDAYCVNPDLVPPPPSVAIASPAANGFPATAIPNRQVTTNQVPQGQDTWLPQVICSTAINPGNAEYRAAIDLGCPIFHRSDVLAALMADYRSIAVSGTHGKTTTSSMLGYLLLEAGLDPTIIVGGEVNAWDGNARVGQGPYLIAEADESDGSLVKLPAEIGIITNIELDHPDHFNTLDDVVTIFKTFAQQCQVTIGCLDCQTIAKQLSPDITYGIQPGSAADYTVTEPLYNAHYTTAQVWERGHCLGELKLKLLGQHNLSNALAVVAVGRQIGLDFPQIAAILADFEGARRRFEVRGEHHGILFVDDYAHHPSEIQATLAAARVQADCDPNRNGRVVAVFQPHRYSRTQTFLEEFAISFKDADLVLSTDIYAASEQNVGQVTGQHVTEAIARHHAQVIFQPSLPEVTAYLQEALMPGDLVLFLGAGNLNKVIPPLMDFYQSLAQPRVEA